MCFDDYILFDEVWYYEIYDWWMDAFFGLYWHIVESVLLACFKWHRKGEKYTYFKILTHMRLSELKSQIRSLMSFIFKIWLLIMEFG